MNYLNIRVPKGIKIAVTSDPHEHSEQYDKILKKVKPSFDKTWIVCAGDFYNKGFGPKEAEKIINTLKPMVEAGYGFAIKGNHEIREIRESRKNNTMTPELEWCEKLPLVLSFLFDNGTRLTVVHGGILPKHKTLEQLATDIEVCYVRDVDQDGEMVPVEWKVIDGIPVSKNLKKGVPWGEVYDGRYGLVCHGHVSQKSGKVKISNYSINIDTACFFTGILTCQVFDESGKNELIQVQGKAKSGK